MKKTIILGVTSGIAAYKSLDLIIELRKADVDVFIIMTDYASKMISPSEFEKASGHKVVRFPPRRIEPAKAASQRAKRHRNS